MDKKPESQETSAKLSSPDLSSDKDTKGTMTLYQVVKSTLETNPKLVLLLRVSLMQKLR